MVNVFDLVSNFCLPFTISVFSLMICYSLIVPAPSWNTGRTVQWKLHHADYK